MSILAIIPARGGSKGIKNKNISLLAGIPLIDYTIQAALKSSYIDQIVVTSDDENILSVASKHNVTLLKRPDFLSTDSASSDGVIAHAISECSLLFNFDHIILLQPTSPLRTENDIDLAWELFKETQANMLISTSVVENKINKAFLKDENGFLKGLISPNAPFVPRQELPKLFIPNGAIYICSVQSFQKKQSLPRDLIISYEMDIERSIDIDLAEDLMLAEKYIFKMGLK